MICLVAAVVAAGACRRGPAVDATQVTAVAVSGALPSEDQLSPLWDRAPEHPATLVPQDVVEPKLLQPGIARVDVRALHNGDWIVFRLGWADATESVLAQTGITSDSVAIQLPMQAGSQVPDPAMGEAGKAVHLLYWKALWQDDAARAAKGQDRVAALYPNATTDHYPFLANPAAKDEMARRYAPADAAGNPITRRASASPVQELVAEGYGTTTAAATQQALGRGAWRAGRWFVTIARPLDEGEGVARLAVGQKTFLAVAVWDGAARQAGGRKMRSAWIPLVLDPGSPK
jgi:DMSO reductase family type II enzyme heme b subunit